MNPITGKRNLRQFPQLLARYLETSIEYKISTSKKKGHAKELATEARNKNEYNTVVAVGGDGTVNEVGSQLIGSDINLGIIPNGSGNGLARELGIPINMIKAICLLNSGNTKRIDVGMVNNQPFFCTAGVGFDAHIGKLFAQSKARGLSTYIQKIISAYWKYAPAEYYISDNDSKRDKHKAFAITLANAKQYGNNAYIAPDAIITDGKLDLCIVKPFPRYKMLALGSRLLMGNINQSTFYKSWKIEKVKIENAHADCFHIDGTHFPLTDGKLEFEIIAKALNVMVP